jgi:hypothetical protein
MIIFLDESGDLGFDFKKEGTTHFFVVTLLVVKDEQRAKLIRKAVERTLRNKVLRRKKKLEKHAELKGSHTSLAVKKYFLRQLKDSEFSIYTIALEKRRVFRDLRRIPERLYNYVARKVIDQLPFQEELYRVTLVIDKSKGKKEVRGFNKYLRAQLSGVVSPNVLLQIDHSDSHAERGLQAADVFCWGIFRKYEFNDDVWYKMFVRRISFERKLWE